MDNLDKIKLVKILSTLPIPVAHVVFAEPQNAPYLIYLDEECENTAANSKTVNKQSLIQLELYTKLKQSQEYESVVETLLDDFTTYEKSHSFIAEESLCITYYRFYF